MTPQTTKHIAIEYWQDIIKARQFGREIASSVGFDKNDQVRIATVISELARNIIQHSGTKGEVVIESLIENGRQGVCIVVNDDGVGIPNVERVLREGCSTYDNLGKGLAASNALMDYFHLQSAPGKGVKVRMIRWRQ